MKIEMFWRRLEYRIKYYWREFWKFFGICHKCYGRMNRTTKGRWICPNINCK